MSQVIQKDKDVLGGAKVFEGTRVPVQTLIDYLKSGDSINVFLEDFPTVKREQVVTLLDEIKNNLNDVA